MKSYPNYLKNTLKLIIKEMNNSTENFVKNPLKDFTRTRKISFGKIITFLLGINRSSLSKELLEYFDFDKNTLSVSALVQQRAKLKKGTFQHLFEKFTKTLKNFKTYKGYRLLAVDDSKINIPHNHKDLDTYIKSHEKVDAKGFNILNVNAIFDLMNKVYLDANIQPIRKHDERQGAINMLENLELSSKALVIADRGYEGYNLFAHLQEKGLKYIIRRRDNNKNAIASSLNI